MKRIPPSERIQKQIDALLEGEWATGDELFTKLILLGAQHLGQEMLEQEVTDYLGRGHSERREESNENSGYRNGYRPARMDTAEGRVKLQVPQVKESAEPYRSRLVDFLRGNSDVLERLAVEMYTRGLSTRDIEDTFREVTGDLLLSRTAVSASQISCGQTTRPSANEISRALRLSICFLTGSMSRCDAWRA